MMTVDDKSILTFEDIWVHGNPLVDQRNDKNSKNKRTRLPLALYQSMPYKMYQKWRGQHKTNPASISVATSPNRALMSGVSGTLSSGELTVLTGASGSGKSVLLRVLAGLVPLDSGNIRLQDTSTLTSPDDASIRTAHTSIHTMQPTEWRQQVALLAQHPQLLEGSVLDNLKMPYRLQTHQTQRFDIDWHINKLAQLDKSTDFLQQATHHLSGGERQLVNTLRLLQLNPQVLLLDEPTAALDTDTSTQLVTLLFNWLHADKQRTALWVTHDTKDVMPLADHHWRMQAGVLTETV